VKLDKHSLFSYLAQIFEMRMKTLEQLEECYLKVNEFEEIYKPHPKFPLLKKTKRISLPFKMLFLNF